MNEYPTLALREWGTRKFKRMSKAGAPGRGLALKNYLIQ
jgi:hypothetical protein